MDQYNPSVIKSCARCRARKVKCDLNIPQCGACHRQQESCNITEYVAYPYAVIEGLHAQVQELKGKLLAQPSHTDQDPRTSSTDHTIGQHGLHKTSEKSAWPTDVSKEAEEVGVLAIGFTDPYSQNKYVGAAAGSTFARIFFKQVGLPHMLDPSFDHNTHGEYISNGNAGVPPYAIAKLLLMGYISRVHPWWPFLRIPYIRSCFQRMYQNARECEDYEKFIFFMILALGSAEVCQSNEYSRMLDLNKPENYFQTAFHFFERFREDRRDLQGLQAVTLLTIWMLNSSSRNHSNDLWHLTRYTMSVALELGLHRHNPSWKFSSEELELRTRTWWAIYSLERMVALATGRVLSVRDQAVDTPFPSHSSLDRLTDSESKYAPIFHSKSIWIFNHMIELRRMSGRVLESIYIARGQNGRCSSLTFQEICKISDDLHRKLKQWKQDLDKARLNSSREYRFMVIEYCMVLLHLNRPSPTFMIPSQQMINICSSASSAALNQWAAIEAEDGITSICRCYHQFHDILITGLVCLYCDWHILKMAQTAPLVSNATVHHRDAAICLDLLDKGASVLQNPLLCRFRTLFSALQVKIYNHATPNAGDPSALSQAVNSSLFVNTDSTSAMGTADSSLDPGGFDGLMFTGTDGLEAYLRQVSNIVDDGIMDVDDTLTAWYGSVLDEIGGADYTSTAENV